MIAGLFQSRRAFLRTLCGTSVALAVPHGGEVVAVINKLAPAFENVILTQDWHPRDHTSFASSHRGKKPFDAIKLSYGNQVLWPDHCVQGTADAALVADLDIRHAELIVRKGLHREVDSYSALHGPRSMRARMASTPTSSKMLAAA